MSWYRRLKIEGGVFFFTVALADRTDDLLVRHVDRLRRMYQASSFSRGLPYDASRTRSKIRKREKGLWQRRYWEHAIRDDADLARHVDYIHFNPVKHGYVSRVGDWPHSSFHRYVAKGDLPLDWGGDVKVSDGQFGE
jgi:putative transposase